MSQKLNLLGNGELLFFFFFFFLPIVLKILFVKANFRAKYTGPVKEIWFSETSDEVFF